MRTFSAFPSTSIVKPIFLLALLGLVSMLAALDRPAMAGACLKDMRQQPVDGANAVRVREYLCRSDRGGLEGLRIELHRLGSLSASIVLFGPMVPQLEAVFGGARVRQNTIYRQYKELVDQFGQPYDAEWRRMDLKVATEQRDPNERRVLVKASGGDEEGVDAAVTERLTAQFAEVRYLDTEEVIDMPLPEASRTYGYTDRWPDGMNFFYQAYDFQLNQGPEESIVIPQTKIWRYVRAEDLASLERNWRRVNAGVGDERGPSQKLMNRVALVQFLTREGFPNDFLVTHGEANECGGNLLDMDFFVQPRDVFVYVAVIRNGSGRPIEIERLLGRAVTRPLLRRASTSQALKSQDVRQVGPGFVLAAGEKVIIPYRIKLEDSVWGPTVEQPPVLMERAKKFYKFIKSFPKDHVFRMEAPSEDIGGPTRFVTKRRRYFKRPREISTSDYVYGAETHFAGFDIGGERILLDGGSENYFVFEVGNTAGSCPFLYAFDAHKGRWTGYGKVIHEANGADRKTTERVRLRALATRFRLTEHELEMSMIDRVRLVVDLKSGKRLFLKPERSVLQEDDGRTHRIVAGASLEFAFNLPPDIERADVDAAFLDVTGFYRRYGATLVSLGAERE